MRKEAGESTATLGRHSGALKDGEKELGRFTRGAAAGSGILSHFGRSIAFASSAFLGAAGFTAVIKQSIGAASDLHEQLNKVDVVFGSSSGTVKQWSKDSATAMGIARAEALRMAGTFGNMLVPMGFARGEAAKMSTHLVQLAADMASFNNADPSEVLKALQSGLAGQVRPLRQFGVFLDQARIKAVALADGIVKPTVETNKLKQAQEQYAIVQDRVTQAIAKHGPKSREAAAAELELQKAADAVSKAMQGHVPALTAAQKAMATYKIVLKDTHDAQGDFARTSNGLANQQRILRAEITNLEEELGGALLPTINKYLPLVTQWIKKNEDNGTFQRDFNKAVSAASGIVQGVIPVVKTIVGLFKTFADNVGGTKNALILIGSVMAGSKVLGAIRTLRTAVALLKADMLFLGSPAMLASIAAGLAAFEAAKEEAATKGKEKLADQGGQQVFGDSFEGHKAGSKPFTATKGVFAGQQVQVKTINGQTWVMPVAAAGTAAGGAGAEAAGKAAAGKAHGAPGATAVAGSTPSGIAISASKSPGAGSTSFHLQNERTPYDCSAFAQAVFKKAGIAIGSTTYTQIAGGRKVDVGDLQADDLVFFNYGNERWPGHVAIYVGNGMVVHDHGASGGVSYTSLSSLAAGSNHRPEGRCYIAAHNHASTGGSTGGTGGTSGAGGFTEKPKPPKATPPPVKTGTDLLSTGARVALAKAQGTTRTGDDLTALKRARDELEKLQKTASKREKVPIAEELGEINKQINQINTDKAKAKADAIATANEKAAARVKKAIDAQKKAWDKHVADLQKIADKAKTTFEDKWSKMADATMTTFDTATSKGLAKMQKDYATAQKDFDKETSDTLTGMAKTAEAELNRFDAETQRGLDALASPDQTPEEKALADFQAGRTTTEHDTHMADLQKAVSDALTGGDPEAIKQAQDALNQQILDDQEAGLQKIADASRKAADKKAADDQKSYQGDRDSQRDILAQSFQDQQDIYQQARDGLASHNDEMEGIAEDGYQSLRDGQRDSLQAWLDAQETALETGATDWQTFFGEIVALSESFGIDAGAAFQGGWLDAAGAGGTAAGAAAAAASAAGKRPPGVAAKPQGKNFGGSTGPYISGYATGGVVGAPRPRTMDPRDTIMARLRPGEIVVTPEQFAAMQASGGPTYNVTITGPVFETRRQIEDAVAGLAQPGLMRRGPSIDMGR